MGIVHIWDICLLLSALIDYAVIFPIFSCDVVIFSYKCRSSPPEVFVGKGVLKICSNFTGENPCRNVTLIIETFINTFIIATNLLKLHFGMGILLYICRIFSEHLFLRTLLDCFCKRFEQMYTWIYVPRLSFFHGNTLLI